MCTFRNPHLIKEYDKIYNNLIGYVYNSALQIEKYLNKEKIKLGLSYLFGHFLIISIISLLISCKLSTKTYIRKQV